MLDLTQPIRTLGLYQPFASLMAFGKIETRWVGKSKSGKWRKPPFPLGPYLIYSCQKAYDVSEGGIDHLCTNEQINLIEALQEENDIFFCEFGIALMIGNLVKIIDPITDEKNTFVKFMPATEHKRRVGLVFENVIRIDPFEFKGKQGTGFLSEEYKRKIKFL